MGTLARQKPELMPAAVGGAVLSTVATIAQMAVVLGATHPATLAAMAVPLISAGLMVVAYGAWFLVKALRQKTPETIEMGRAFSFRSALILAATMGAVLLAAAALNAWLGRAGLIAGTAIAGFGSLAGSRGQA